MGVAAVLDGAVLPVKVLERVGSVYQKAFDMEVAHSALGDRTAGGTFPSRSSSSWNPPQLDPQRAVPSGGSTPGLTRYPSAPAAKAG